MFSQRPESPSQWKWVTLRLMAEVRPNRLGECQGSYINPRGFYLDSVQAADQCCRRENHISDVSEVDAEYFENADEHEDHDIMPFHDEPAPPYERFQRTLNFTQADSHTEATITRECDSSARWFGANRADSLCRGRARRHHN